MSRISVFISIILTSIIAINGQLSKKISFYSSFVLFLIIQIVQRMIRVVDMDIVKIVLLVHGVVNVNFGGMEQRVMY